MEEEQVKRFLKGETKVTDEAVQMKQHLLVLVEEGTKSADLMQEEFSKFDLLKIVD